MRKYFLLILFLLCGSYLHSQQIVRVGVLDFNRVVSTIAGDPRTLQEIERLVRNFEEGLNNFNIEIAELEDRRQNFLHNGDNFSASRVEQQITRRREELARFTRDRTREIENRRSRINQSPEVLARILREIEHIAESQGFSMVFNSQDPNLIWWSKSVDITDLVINRLRPRN
ncbi:MAG: OmpH family outer membrane protein [Spirochaetes bacterium]|nr:OmpH family outer membrane protein [Spirochaetota bacterium]